MKKFAFVSDVHYGTERVNGHKRALHDPKAINCALRLLEDFKPTDLIMGGDILDSGVISHHNHGKPGRTEGIRLLEDAENCAKDVIQPLRKLGGSQTFIVGNHEDWLTDLSDQIPGLEGLLNLERLLPLQGVKVVPVGGHHQIGKLTFIHGDQITGGEHMAKSAVLSYEASVVFGHFHTFQTFTKNSALDFKKAKMGVASGCLCTKAPRYGEGKPNKWLQGITVGYIHDDGTFNLYPIIILDGKTTFNGKTYKG